MAKADLDRGLERDVDDEAEAVREYGKRGTQARQAGRPRLAKALGKIRKDERRHHATVSRASSRGR